MNPEFLREGDAVIDFMNPDRIVIGEFDRKSGDTLEKVYKNFKTDIVRTSLNNAEMIKYANNSLLATMISFSNEIANIAQTIEGANAFDIFKGVYLDKRLNPVINGKRVNPQILSYLHPGCGFGGSCFPKDVKALIATAKQHGYDFNLLKEAENINHEAMDNIVKKAIRLLKGEIADKTIGIFGLSFKPNTDDMRDAPSITVINKLQKNGARIRAYDPIAVSNARKIFKNVSFCKDPYSVAKDADLIIIMTEWNEFKELDLHKIKRLMKKTVLLDGRNIYDPKLLREIGFTYEGVGR